MKTSNNVNMSTFEHGHKKVINIFVEGLSTTSIDKPIIDGIFKSNNNSIDCKMVGFCTNVIAASQLLYKENNNNYFLIDRDHHDNTTINKSWTSDRKNNLIIWKKRHIENYFLNPNFLMKSSHIKGSVKEIELISQIEDLANNRFFTDVVNLVLINLREKLKKNWVKKIGLLPNNNEDEALNTLLEMNEINNFKSNVDKELCKNSIIDSFNYYKNEFTGGESSLKLGCGNWINLIEGKPILNQILNTNFIIKKSDNTNITGEELKLKVLKDLMIQTSENDWPDDFQLLKKIILS